MSSQAQRKRKSTTDFWRAVAFLYPYWRLVLISIGCALFVSLAATSGLSALLPITQIFFKGDTVASWADRSITAHRLGTRLADEVGDVRIIRVEPESAAAKAGLRDYEIISVAMAGDGGVNDARNTASVLSDPGVRSVVVHVRDRGDARLQLPPVPFYLAAGRGVAHRFPEQPVKAIGIVLGLIGILAVISNVMSFFQEYLSDKAAILAVNDIRRRLYDHILHVPLSHFNLQGTSDVTSRLVQDALGLQEGYKTILGQSIQEPLKAALAFGLALTVSWKLTLFVVVFAPVMLVFIKKLGKKMRRASKKALVSSSVMLGQIEGSLAGIRVVKGAGAERFERRRYGQIMKGLVREQLRMSRLDAFSGPTLETLTFFVIATVVMFASYMVLMSKSLSMPGFFLVMACLGSIGDSLRRVSKVNNVLQKANAAAARIFEVMELPIERTRVAANVAPSRNGHASPAGGLNGSARANGFPRVKVPPLQREVRFEQVRFSYPGSSAQALDGVDLVVPKGSCVAIVGRNGSGKTTLLALLPRFYDPQGGRILLDGLDIRHATLRSLRQQISIVTQDSVIFPGTIEQNIAYGDPVTSRAEVEGAARRAFAHDFIMEKPQGYQTLLGGLGSQLSGGQKQRICIARAIYRKAPILILDEATSQVDAESEQLIQKAIDGLLHERTTFVIAHRFSTIKGADFIVVMDRGQIVGQGRHDELLATCPTYQQLYEGQLLTVAG